MDTGHGARATAPGRKDDLKKRKPMEDVARVITVGRGARAYLAPTKDRTGPIRTGCRATTQLAHKFPRAVAAIGSGTPYG
jgi:hypothetical protein